MRTRRRSRGRGRRLTRRVTNRRRPRARQQWLAIGGAALALAIAIPVAVGALVDDRTPCAAVLLDDKSGSADDPALDQQRISEANRVLIQQADCDWVLISTVNALLGEAEFWVGPLRGRGDTPLDRRDDARQNREAAQQHVDAIFGASPQGLTNYFAAFHEVDDALDELASSTEVEVWVWGDGINTVPVNFYDADLSPQGIQSLLAFLEPLPDCSWPIHFVGVNRGVGSPLPDGLAEGAEQFWRTYVSVCGGTVASYTPTIPDAAG